MKQTPLCSWIYGTFSVKVTEYLPEPHFGSKPKIEKQSNRSHLVWQILSKAVV